MKKLTWLLLFGLPGYTFLSIFRLIYFKKPEFDALVKISKIQLYPFNYKILHRKKILEFQKSYPAKVDFFRVFTDFSALLKITELLSILTCIIVVCRSFNTTSTLVCPEVKFTTKKVYLKKIFASSGP